MEKPYCGIKAVPKGKRQGNMKECVQANQIRRFGLAKVDSRLLQLVDRKLDKEKQKLKKNIIIYRTKIRKANTDLKYAKTKEQKDELTKKIKELEREYNDFINRLKKM